MTLDQAAVAVILALAERHATDAAAEIRSREGCASSPKKELRTAPRRAASKALPARRTGGDSTGQMNGRGRGARKPPAVGAG